MAMHHRSAERRRRCSSRRRMNNATSTLCFSATAFFALASLLFPGGEGGGSSNFLLVSVAAQNTAHDRDAVCPAAANRHQAGGNTFHQRDETSMSNTQPKSSSSGSSDPPNVLFIMTDQQRFDMIGSIQNSLSHYQGKTKVHTPNLDRLMSEGTTFTRHFCQSPICGPARGTLRTGCTIERTGIQTNSLTSKNVYSRDPQFFNKVKNIDTLDQILARDRGYINEHYGKWHLPIDWLFYKKGTNNKKNAVRNNNYDHQRGKPFFDEHKTSTGSQYRQCLKASKHLLRDELLEGEQINPYARYPYTPTLLDSRYGLPSGTSSAGRQGTVIGRDSLSENYTPTHCESTAGINAIERLASEGKPWSLTVSFHNPHAPFVATGKYFDRYWDNRTDFFIPPSIDTDHMEDSPYKPSDDPAVADASKVKEWMVSYYALVEEVDHHVGRLLHTLNETGQASNTLVLFTSDHGETLGAHGTSGKIFFYEESVRVPLILRLPGHIPEGNVVDIPTSHLDIVSTILDYTHSAEYDKSDGSSLRRHMDGVINDSYDDEVVVSERDPRTPRGGELEGNIGANINFMVVKGSWKLLMTKKASSPLLDAMYNTEEDPFEMNNLLVTNSTSGTVIGKAEHLKALLIEWMERMDGPQRLYSDRKYNGGEGQGDIKEIQNRRKWQKMPIWVSDASVAFGMPRTIDGHCTRTEYLYLGRTINGKLDVESITLEGEGSHHFSLSEFSSGSISSGNYRRVKVTYRSSDAPLHSSSAQIRIRHSAGDDVVVGLHLNLITPTLQPSTEPSDMLSTSPSNSLSEHPSSSVKPSVLPRGNPSDSPSSGPSSTASFSPSHSPSSLSPVALLPSTTNNVSPLTSAPSTRGDETNQTAAMQVPAFPVPVPVPVPDGAERSFSGAFHGSTSGLVPLLMVTAAGCFLLS